MNKASKPVEEAVPSRSVMVRSLRRRLWKALQEEDVATATRAYTATKTDYERWLDEELVEEELLRKRKEEKKDIKQKERRDARPMALKKLGAFVNSPRVSMDTKRSLKESSRSLLAGEVRKSQFMDDDGDSFGSSQPILQSELHPNDEFVRDDFYGPHDSYDVELLSPPMPKVKKESSMKSKRMGPRLAGFMPWRSPPSRTWGLHEAVLKGRLDFQEEPDKVDENMTTLMHEASRIACPDFVRLLLGRGGNPNVRNGQQRTALHMVAGGMLEQESRFVEQEAALPSDVGIRTPVVDLNDEEGDEKDEQKMHKKAARAMSRMFLKLKDGVSADAALKAKATTVLPSGDDVGRYTSQRMDTLLCILSWFHPDDNTPAAGEGPTINSVDARGRTALHYAAETGRTDLCLTILTSFGAILTIVDESGRTPCELAAEQKHPDLAAQLEARALLYTDPYGLDEDLLASVWAGSSDDEVVDTSKKKKKRSAHSKLVPPFSWYETWKMEKVRLERQHRVTTLFGQMQEALVAKQEHRESIEFMYNHGVNDSIEEDMVHPDAAVVATKAEKHTETIEEKANADQEKLETEEMTTKPPAEPSKAVENNPETATDEGTAPQCNSETGNEEGPASQSWSEQESQDVTAEKNALEKPVGVVPTMRVNEELSGCEEAVRAVASKATSEENSVVVKLVDGVATKPMGEFHVLSKVLQEAYVEQFAAFHSWNTAAALKTFGQDPFAALTGAGIDIQAEELPATTQDDTPALTLVCLICCDEMDAESENWVDLSGCDHAFCSDCLGDYVSECARSRDNGVAIKCPHHECSIPLSLDEVEKLAPSPDVYESLLKASDENFVAMAADLCFCPHPGCDGVVRRFLPGFVSSAKLDRNLIDLCGAVCTGGHLGIGVDDPQDDSCPLTYDGVRDPNYKMTRNAVQPKRPHRFCYSCGSQTTHWPIQCDALEEWKEKIANEIGELDEPDAREGDCVNFNDVAQRLWMKANTRPCPKCKAPIEKNDGCNHMTCSNRNCRHEFCWICREDWKLHNTDTGGFFRCNRWQADDNHEYYDTQPPPEQRTTPENNTTEALSSEVNYGTALHSSRVAWKKSKDMGLFLHNYRRWTAHKESAALERQMADTVCFRLAPVVEAAIDFNGHDNFDFGGKGLSFIHAAFTELLECRILLQHSYAFAFFRFPIQYHIRRDRLTKSKEREKLAFEQLQSELEMLTEQTSDIVARKHLRATQMQIMFLTNGVCQKRSELTSFMLSLLNEQLKEAKEEAERVKREKNRPTVDRLPNDLGSIFDFPPRDFSARHHHHNHHPYHAHGDLVTSRLRRLMDNQNTRRSPFDDSDEDEDFRIRPGRTSAERVHEEVMQDGLRASVQAFFQFTSDGDVRDNDVDTRFQDWACNECTYMNAVGRHCAMCGTARR